MITTILLWVQALLIVALLLFATRHVLYLFTWLFTDPPSVPTDKRTRRVMIHQIITYKPDAKIIYDLGSGYGQLAFAAAKRFPDAQVIGFEIFWLPYFMSRFKKKLYGYKNVSFKKANLFEEDLSDADVVLNFLFPKFQDKLQQKFKEELKDNALIISNQFALPTWKAKKIKELPCLIGKRTIYTYKKHPTP